MALLLAAASCRPSPLLPPRSSPTPEPLATATPQRDASQRAATPIPAPQAGELVLWLPPSLSPQAEGEGGRVMAQLLAEFEQAHGTRVRVELKKPYGEGGILDVLQAAHPVVPELLPDVAALDMTELSSLHERGIGVPLNDLLSGDLLRGLAPVGLEGSTREDQLLGVPLLLDLQHLVYSPAVAAEVPATWAALLKGPHVLLFPAGMDPGPASDVVLQHYVSRGGRLEQEGQRIVLDRTKLVQTLELFAQGRAAGVFPTQVLDLGGWSEVLDAFGAPGGAPLAQVSASTYLARREELSAAGYAPVPTITGHTFALVRGWTLVLLAREPGRQAAAIELTSWLAAEQRALRWAEAARVLPASERALGRLAGQDPYFSFASALLGHSAPYPAVSRQLLLSQALQRALHDVLLGRATPEQAASEALLALSGGGS